MSRSQGMSLKFQPSQMILNFLDDVETNFNHANTFLVMSRPKFLTVNYFLRAKTWSRCQSQLVSTNYQLSKPPCLQKKLQKVRDAF